MAEHNEKPLAAKLGIEQGMAVSIFNAPNYFEIDLGDLPDDVEVHRDADDAPADLFLIFADRSDEAKRGFERAVTNMTPDGVIWFAWPRESSDRARDIDEDTLRDLLQPDGMVDDGSCVIDETWSGMKFVVGEESREDWPPDGDATD